MEFLYFKLYSLSLALSVDITQFGFAPLFPCLRYFYMLIRFPLSTCFSKLSSPCSVLAGQMLQFLNHLCCLSLDLLQYFYLLPILGSPELNPALQVCLTRIKCQEQGKAHLSQRTGDVFPNTALEIVWPSLPQARDADSRSAFCLPGPEVLLCQAASQLVSLHSCPKVLVPGIISP